MEAKNEYRKYQVKTISPVEKAYLETLKEISNKIDDKVIGTQPLCYCEELTLINCEMIDTDLAFEYSEVNADIKGHIDSIKNPKSGKIKVDRVGEVIKEGSIMEDTCEIVIKSEED